MLNWLANIQNTQPIASGVIILSLVAALGLALGSVRIRKFSLGPIIIFSLIARLVVTLNFTSLCGVLAGSQADPPALAFAHGMCGSEAPSIAYGSVYPLTRRVGSGVMVLCIVILMTMLALFY